MAAFANRLLSFDSPDALWRRKPTLDKLAVEGNALKDARMSGAMAKVYRVLYRRGWSSRCVRGVPALQENLAEEAGMPVTTMRRHLTELRAAGFVAGKRYSHLTHWILFPTPEELEADPVRRRHKPRQTKPRARQQNGRFCRKSDCPQMVIPSDHMWTITSPQTIDSKEEFSASSSINENTSVLRTFEDAVAVRDDERRSEANEPPARSVEIAPEPIPVEGRMHESDQTVESVVDTAGMVASLAAAKGFGKSKYATVAHSEQSESAKQLKRNPRDSFIEWYKTRFPEVLPPSIRDMEEIENAIAQHRITWDRFLQACKEKSRGKSTNPIGLVKSLAKDYPRRFGLPKVVEMPQTYTRERDDWWNNRLCPTCKSRSGRLPDGTPCPDCPLGRDLARVET